LKRQKKNSLGPPAAKVLRKANDKKREFVRDIVLGPVQSDIPRKGTKSLPLLNNMLKKDPKRIKVQKEGVANFSPQE